MSSSGRVEIAEAVSVAFAGMHTLHPARRAGAAVLAGITLGGTTADSPAGAAPHAA